MQEMRTNTRLKIVILILVSVVGVALDRITKILTVNNLDEGKGISVISGILNFTYIKNQGAAFGSLVNARWIFMVASTLLIVVICVYIFYKKNLGRLELAALSMIVSGGIGNMIDRIAYGYVVDFVDVIFLPFWKWIFNIADMLVCVGAALFIISFVIGEIKNKKGKESNVSI